VQYHVDKKNNKLTVILPWDIMGRWKHLILAYRLVKTENINLKTKFIKTLIGNVVRHPKQHKFIVSFAILHA